MLWGNGRSQSSDDFVALPASWFGEGQALARMRLLRVPVLAHERIGVLLLIEVAESVVDFAMLALICTDCYLLVGHSRYMYVKMMLTVKK
jgi:hypothetical protein